MAINFPNSPTDGQTYTAEGQTWTWSAAGSCWYMTEVSFPGTADDYVQKAGDVMTGALEVPSLLVTGNAAVGGMLTLAADPTQPLEAATKGYVDAKAVTERTTSDGKYVDITGDTMTGPLNIGTTSLDTAGLINAGGNLNVNGGTLRIRSDGTPSLAFQTAAGITGATLNLSQSSGRFALQTYGASTNTALQLAADAEAPVAFFWKAGVNVARVDGAGTDLSSAVSVVTREKGDARYLQLSQLEAMPSDDIGNAGGKVSLTIADGYGNASVTFNHANSGTPMQNGSSARISSTVDSTTASMSLGLKDNVTLGTKTSVTNVLTLTTALAQFEVPVHINGALTTYNRFSFTRTDGASYIDFDDATGNTAPLVFRNNVDGSVASIGLNDDTAVNAHTIITRRKGDARFLQLAGGVLTGLLTLSADPTDALHAATKQYVDTQVATALDQTEGDARYAQLAASNTFFGQQNISSTGEGGQLSLIESTSGKVGNLDMIAASNMMRIFHNMDGAGTSAYEFPANAEDKTDNSVMRKRDLTNSGGDAPIYGARAWAYFAGGGAIQAAGNITSITNPATGRYTVNFDIPMPHAEYATAGAARTTTGSHEQITLSQRRDFVQTTTQAYLSTGTSGGASSVSIFISPARASVIFLC